MFVPLFLSIVGYSQVTITMEESGGVYKIPCTVNGLKMKFVFDTGASVVSLSQSMASFMMDNGYLSDNDYLGKSQTQIADGSTVDVLVVNLKDFEVGGFHLSNVTATVKDGQNVPLLMGMSAIEKLGKVSLSGNKLMIHKPSVKLSTAEIASLRNEIQRLFKAEDWDRVIEKSERLKNATTFNSQWDYYYYIMAIRQSDVYHIRKGNVLLDLCDEWETSNIQTSDKIRGELYRQKATYLSWYSMDDDADSKSLDYYKKALPYSTLENRWSILHGIALYYDGFEVKNGKYAIDYLKQAIDACLEYKKVSLAMVLENKVKDTSLGNMYFSLAEYEEKYNKDYSQRDFYLKLSAKCGYQDAIDFCFENNINFLK